MASIDVSVPNLSGRQILRMLSRRRYVAILTYALIVLGSAAYCFFWPPSYAAGVSFLIKRDREEPILSSDEHSIRTLTRQSLTEEELNDEAELVQSGPVLEQTVRDLHIAELPEHWAIRLLNAPLQFVNGIYNEYHQKPTIDATHAAMERLARKLEVTPGKKSDVLEIHVLWGDPEFARQIVNRLAVHYEAAHQQLHSAPDTLRFYQEQFGRAQADVQQLESQIEHIHPGALLGGLQAEKDMSLHQAAEFEAEWRKTQARKSELEARLASRARDLAGLPERIISDDKTQTNPLALGTLKNQILELELKHSQLLAKYKPENFLVQEAEHDLAKARSMLAAERAEVYHEQTTTTNKVAEALKQDLLWQRGEDASTGALADELKNNAALYADRLQRLNRDGARLQQLQLLRQTAQESMLQYARRYEEARIQSAMNRTQFVNVAPIGPAWATYSPVKPNTMLLLKLALGTGIFVALGLALAVDLLRGHVHEPADLAGILDAAFIGALENHKPLAFASWTRL